MSMSNYLEEAFLKTMRGGGNGTSFTAPTDIYVQLHTADPGEDGTASVAGNAVRQRLTSAAPANPGGTMDSNADATWTNVSTTETYSHFSTWDASSRGNPLMIGALSASRSVTAGDTFTLPSASLQQQMA